MVEQAFKIPEELRPRDGRFGSGPSKVRREQLEALCATGDSYLGTSHRREGVRSKVRALREGLRELFSLPDGYEVALGLGGASLFFDALAFSLISRRSQHVVMGEFSQRCYEVARGAPHLEPPELIEAPYGKRADPRPSSEVDLYALIENGTSTGVWAPVARPSPEGIVAVDATSAAGAVRVDPAEFDCYYFSPQKAFAGEGGLWFALLSPGAISRIEEVKASGRYIPDLLDLHLALENSRRDQTYNTPPLAGILLMLEQLRWMLSHGGLDWAASRSDLSSEIVYSWAEKHPLATPFVSEPTWRSHTVATIDFASEVDAGLLAGLLREQGILDTEPYRKLGRNQLRIALFPAIEPGDVEALTACIDYLLERIVP